MNKKGHTFFAAKIKTFMTFVFVFQFFLTCLVRRTKNYFHFVIKGVFHKGFFASIQFFYFSFLVDHKVGAISIHNNLFSNHSRDTTYTKIRFSNPMWVGGGKDNPPCILHH